jgi:hypothetical protein
LFAGQDTYVSVAVQNLSFAQSAPFSICLFFDASDSPQHCWNSDSGLLPQAALILENAILDSALVPTPGQHFIKLVIDPDNRVQEANEINNIWFRSYYWQEAGTCGPISSSGLTQSNLPPDPWVAQDLFIPTAPALLPDTLLPATIQQDSSTNLYRVALNPGSANQTRPKTAVRAPVLQTTDSKNEWQLVLYEDFEGSFPEDNGWSLVNTTPELCEYLWDSDQTRYAPPTGSHAGWPARGGRNGVSPASSKYPPNTRSWMIYGPFSLEKAADARLTFDLWRDLEAPYDSLFAGASKDGIIFDGVLFSDEGGWAKKQIDLDQYSGSSLVWIVFLFTSDPSGQFTGPWVDNILVEQEIKPKQIYLPVIAR